MGRCSSATRSWPMPGLFQGWKTKTRIGSRAPNKLFSHSLLLSQTFHHIPWTRSSLFFRPSPTLLSLLRLSICSDLRADQLRIPSELGQFEATSSIGFAFV